MKRTKKEKEELFFQLEQMLKEFEADNAENRLFRQTRVRDLIDSRKRETVVYAVVWTALAMSCSALVVAILIYNAALLII